ncbi:MAG: 5,6-dimethylbenzimidazole synthase [Moraxellaceae bacterium]|nr:MAG: 5,6-dimethylbenzimidazole synthase [Moraxellaceae bacterium]
MENKPVENCADLVNQDFCFTQEERDALYKTIFNRRDVRGQFKPDAIPDEVLARVLQAAHHAPSVGFMQPWNFIVIRSKETKLRVHQGFVEANEEAAKLFKAERQETYRNLKLEGIKESPINICITCDRNRCGPHVLGRTHIKTTDLYSSVCAVQNLWLAARAEGLGVGWVSIIKQQALKDALNIPDDIVPIAYLCVGYVSHFNKKPDLENAGWRKRLPLEDLVFFDQWNEQRNAEEDSLIKQIELDADFSEQFMQYDENALE